VILKVLTADVIRVFSKVSVSCYKQAGCRGVTYALNTLEKEKAPEMVGRLGVFL